jgi:hypothetical protein
MIENCNGPPISDRLSFEEATYLLEETGYQNIIKIDIGEDYYGITATKP